MSFSLDTVKYERMNSQQLINLLNAIDNVDDIMTFIKNNRTKGPIRYKVVNPDRTSIYAYGKYQIKYDKGIVVAPKNSLGMMVFKTRTRANEWASQNISSKNFKILKVRGLTRGKSPKIVSICYRPEAIDEFWKYRFLMKPPNGVHHLPPTGTICYEMIEVLE